MRESPELSLIDRKIEEEVKPISLDNTSIQQQVEEIVRCLRLVGGDLVRLSEVFREEMEKGLHDLPSSLSMQNTYIPELPDGTEEGECLALDLGGTNFRIALIKFKRGQVEWEKIRKYDISADLKVGCGIKLFDYISECVSHFIHLHEITNKIIPLGFTFSFPMIQKALDVGVLKVWTKSYVASSVEGNDVVQILKDALKKKGVNNIDITAVLNDTTGTLVHGAALDKETRIGLVLGTGTNAAYMEQADRVTHWETVRHGEKEVIINIEWGALGDNGALDFIKTQFDKEVDRNSLIVNSFTFEKYISGKYMGEIVRAVLVHLIRKGLLFNGRTSPKFETPNIFTTSYVSHIEEDTINNKTTETEKVLNTFDLTYSRDDIEIVKMVCEVVSLRAALLISACLSVLMKRINKPSVTIAVDGSLFQHHPRFKCWMEKFVSLLAPGYKFRFSLVEDGSSKGGAMTAAIALRLREHLKTSES